MPIFNFELWRSESQYQLWFFLFVAAFFFLHWLISKRLVKVGNSSRFSLTLALVYLSFSLLQALRVQPPGWQPWMVSISTAVGAGLLLLALLRGIRALWTSSRIVKEATLLVASFPVMLLILLMLADVFHWTSDWKGRLFVLWVYAMFAVSFRVFAYWRKQRLDEHDHQ